MTAAYSITFDVTKFDNTGPVQIYGADSTFTVTNPGRGFNCLGMLYGNKSIRVGELHRAWYRWNGDRLCRRKVVGCVQPVRHS